MKSLISKILLLLFCLSTINCNKVSFSSIEDAIKTTDPSEPVVVIPPPVIIETPSQLDILVVIDNSSSMLSEHAIIAEKLKGFTSKLASMDYKIAVTTTDASVDMNDGFFAKKPTPRGFGGKALLFNESNFVSASTVDGENLLLASLDRSQEASCSNPEDTEEESQNYWEAEDVQSEICSTDTIEPLKVIQQFLEQQNTANAGFLRPNAPLAVLIISDEDLNSTESETVSIAAQLKAIQSLKSNMKAYGIIAQKNDISNCQANWSGQTSKKIQNFIRLSGGTHHSICDDDYTSIFDNIVQDIR